MILCTAKGRSIAIPTDLDTEVAVMFSKAKTIARQTARWKNASKNPSKIERSQSQVVSITPSESTREFHSPLALNYLPCLNALLFQSIDLQSINESDEALNLTPDACTNSVSSQCKPLLIYAVNCFLLLLFEGHLCMFFLLQVESFFSIICLFGFRVFFYAKKLSNLVQHFVQISII